MVIAKRLGDLHVSEIATLALDVMSAASTFIIPHKPKERLCLRIGIHSGPAVGGIQKVGDSIPRYAISYNETYQSVIFGMLTQSFSLILH